LFILQFFAAGGIPKGDNKGDAPMAIILIAGALALVSVVIRFVIVPKIFSKSGILSESLLRANRSD